MATDEPLRLGETFDLLTHEYRRIVLYRLTETTGATDVESLVTAIVGRNGSHPGTDRGDDHQAVEVALRHSHLPRLADAGVVAFDRDADTVELQRIDEVDRFLSDAASIDGYRRTVGAD
jgi:hypothetical protein